MRSFIIGLLVILTITVSAPAFAAESSKSGDIAWQDWNPGVFETARKEHKLVYMELEAIWCHWCHVMDQTTYQDASVIKQFKEHYIPVKVNQDAHPDLSQRYENYGWPAIIIFDADGKEIVKHRGYVDPEGMNTLLQDTYANPVAQADSEGPAKASGKGALTTSQRDRILTLIAYRYDADFGGWGTNDKFLEANIMTFAINQALQSNLLFNKMSHDTLEASYNLIDPVWGGVYQYSDQINWKSPHFEKILSIQSDYILSYAYGYAAFGDEAYIKAANDVLRYLDSFMTSPDGAFYTSQDADLSADVKGHAYYALNDAERRKLGMPHIDTNIYSNENGRMISSLARLYAMGGDKTALDRALKAVNWIKAHRAATEKGAFMHGETAGSGLFLSDTLWMARAMLDLYAVTGDRSWLAASEESAKYVREHFLDSKGGGFYTTPNNATGLLKPFKHLDDNIVAARFFNLLSIYTGNADYRKDAASAMRYAAAPEQIDKITFAPGTLLANDELAADPLHLVVVGRKDDAAAQELFRTAIAAAPLYKQTEWYDEREGKLPDSSVDYPKLEKAAAFVCTGDSCSPPAYDSEKLKETIRKALAASATSEAKAKPVEAKVAADMPISAKSREMAESSNSFWLLLGFAFLGGLILNIMPCVLPILSLKAFALVKKAQESRAVARRHGLAYTGGVVVSFILIAAVLLGLRASGEAIGWGFQLQSPVFVAVLFVLIAGAAANLVGLFELPPLLGGVETNQDSIRGSVLTGVLAVAVATPCTAPFMATAVGATLLLSTAQSLLVFTAMGVGMAFPFTLISFSPRALALLPKPGAWMLTFKKLLAIPMALTALWLGYVFLQLVQAPSDGSQAHSSTYNIVKTEAYSATRLDELRAQHVPVLLDATAEWCITCKVNERIALRPEETQKFLKDNNVTLMVADWTSGDAEITKLLAEFDRNGVPLYVFYPPKGDPVTLPQVLTTQTIIDTLKPYLKQK